MAKESNHKNQNKSLNSAKEKLAKGRKFIADLMESAAEKLAAGLNIQNPTPIPVRITKRS